MQMQHNNLHQFADLDNQLARDTLKFKRDDFGDVSITLDRVIITHLD
jgi:hypothetical protein